MTRLARVLARLSSLALWLPGAGLVAMTAAVTWLVFGRYVLNSSLTQAEPLSLLLMTWFIFLGAAVGVREGTHLGFRAARPCAPAPRGRHGERQRRGGGRFGGFMAVFGWRLAAGSWAATLPSLDLPGGVTSVPVVAGSALFVLFGLERLARCAAGSETAPARPLVDAAARAS